jgi:hypothetical protein
LTFCAPVAREMNISSQTERLAIVQHSEWRGDRKPACRRPVDGMASRAIVKRKRLAAPVMSPETGTDRNASLQRIPVEGGGGASGQGLRGHVSSMQPASARFPSPRLRSPLQACPALVRCGLKPVARRADALRLCIAEFALHRSQSRQSLVHGAHGACGLRRRKPRGFGSARRFCIPDNLR